VAKLSRALLVGPLGLGHPRDPVEGFLADQFQALLRGLNRDAPPRGGEPAGTVERQQGVDDVAPVPVEEEQPGVGEQGHDQRRGVGAIRLLDHHQGPLVHWILCRRPLQVGAETRVCELANRRPPHVLEVL
jgi:hypothetical protein